MTNAGPPTGGSWGQDPSGQNPAGSPGQPPYGQPPQYGQQPPQYGQPTPPAYGQQPPQYGQPQYGQPTPPAYGQQPPAFGQSPQHGQQPPKKSNSTALILAAVAVVVVIVGVVLAITLTGGDDNDSPQGGGGGTSQSSEPTDDPTDESTDDPTDDPTRPSGGDVTVSDARDLADQYFDDIAAQDPDHAKTLLCESAAEQFEDTLAEPQSDFDFTFTNVDYISGKTVGDEAQVIYDVQGYLTEDKATTVDARLTFQVVSEDGEPKLCGEKGVPN